MSKVTRIHARLPRKSVCGPIPRYTRTSRRNAIIKDPEETLMGSTKDIWARITRWWIFKNYIEEQQVSKFNKN